MPDGGVSARARLVDAFWDDGTCTPENCYYDKNAEATVNQLVDAFAHEVVKELAQFIRARSWEMPCPAGCCPGDTPYDVADFIEREALKRE